MLVYIYGAYSSSADKTIGILIVYQLINMNLTPIKIITGYPQSIIDACFIKRYIICGIESALCVREYFVKNNSIEWNKDVRSIMISNYMNKITNLIPKFPINLLNFVFFKDIYNFSEDIIGVNIIFKK